MAHHKRKRAKNARAGCLLCKPHKMNGLGSSLQSRPTGDRRVLQELLADVEREHHDKEVTSGFA